MPPESTDAYFTYPEVRNLDVALERLHAASRAVDVAVRSMSAQALEKSYEELHASMEASPEDHPTNPERIESTRPTLNADELLAASVIYTGPNLRSRACLSLNAARLLTNRIWR